MDRPEKMCALAQRKTQSLNTRMEVIANDSEFSLSKLCDRKAIVN